VAFSPDGKLVPSEASASSDRTARFCGSETPARTEKELVCVFTGFQPELVESPEEDESFVVVVLE